MKRFLDQVYVHSERHEDTMALYDEWAASYDAEVTENGYATPMRCTEALLQTGANVDARVLDVGCGTGISGQALRDGGFSWVDGSDTNHNMLKQARAREGVYRQLMQVSLDDPFPFPQGTYQILSAIGVIAARHAPPETIGAILQKLDTGGLFVFSLNDHTLEDTRYESEIDAHIAAKRVRVVFRQYGPHLPGMNMGSVVYVLERR